VNLKSLHWVLVFLCFVLGTFLRTWDFIENPGGLNQDELGSVYEAFALWTEGTDRWGLSWPSYFPAWGSGQNALLTYLSIPLVAVFGPSVFVVRGIVLASALATLPLIYFFARLAFCRTTALVALFFTAVCPWHVMMSRWGLESNLLPFFWMATMVSLQLGFRPQGANVFRVLAPVLAAVSLYAYSVAAFSMTAFVGFAVLFFWREFAKCWRMWMVGLAAGFVLGLPLLHFLLKNHVFKANLAVDAFVPWTAPLLPITRLAQLSGGTVDVVKANFFDFVGASFADGLVWNTLPGHRPLPEVLSFLALFGIVALFLDARRGSRAGFIALAALLGASVPLFFFFVNVNRANGLYLPLILVAARGVAYLSTDLLKGVSNVSAWWRKVTWVCAGTSLFVLVALFASPSFLFAKDYFRTYSATMQSVFRAGVPEAILLAKSLADAKQVSIFFDDSIFMNYIYVLATEKMTPSAFLENSNANTNRFFVSRVGPWRFSKADARSELGMPLVFVNLSTSPFPCQAPSAVHRHGAFVVGACP
jgi:hypothetical protein